MGIGGSRVAVVRAGERARAMAPPPPSAPALDDAERFARAVDAAAAPPESWLARNVRTLLGVGVGLIVVAGGVMAIAWATGHAAPTGDQRVAMVRQALAPTRIPLTVVQRDGQLRVSGHVKDQAARALVEKTVAATGLEGVKLDLWVNESVTHGASEVFRLNGIAAKASTLGPGMVRLETATADEAVLTRAKEAALRDVPGLAELDVVNTPPPGNGARTVADAGKRIASIVAGEPSYVVTQDGARYFPGALLPSGHRIQEIRPNEVVLDLNGQTSRLNF
jgi:type III secretion protein D